MSAEFFAYQDACVEVVDSILAGAVELTPALFNKAGERRQAMLRAEMELEARFEAEALAADADAQAEAEEFSR
ncbi:hypothetical protein WKY82_09015 [Gordonia malaquae]|uniref:hypothetical protein n=1 Tax=Gordonia malaquae TaxID=410332 RepID=UPI0030C78AD8